MNLTNLLLLLILSVLATYVFTPWKGMEKGSTLSITFQFILWIIFFFNNCIRISENWLCKLTKIDISEKFFQKNKNT